MKKQDVMKLLVTHQAGNHETEGEVVKLEEEDTTAARLEATPGSWRLLLCIKKTGQIWEQEEA